MFIMLPSCSHKKNHDSQFVVYSKLNNIFEDTLVSSTRHDFISEMELRIVGKLEGKGMLFYSHCPYTETSAIELEGNINKIIKSEWYDEKCLIKYIPENSLVSGKVIISFEVY